MTTRTTIHVDTLHAEIGAVSFGYTSEDDRVYMSVNDPTDNRRAAHMLSLNPENLQQLKEVIAKLDEVIKQEKTRLFLTKSDAQGFNQSGSTVSIPIGTSTISIPRDLYEQMAALIAAGQTIVAASKINAALPWLGLPGARAVAQSICDYQQATGTRT
jgi:hypothetical protein